MSAPESSTNPPPTNPIKVPPGRSVEFIMKSQQALIDSYAWNCCLNCEHWTESHKVQVPDNTKYSGWSQIDEGPRCMKYGVRPPTKIITVGCQDYVPGIPF